MMDVEEVTSMSSKESDLQFLFHSIGWPGGSGGGKKELIEFLFITNGPILFQKTGSYVPPDDLLKCIVGTILDEKSSQRVTLKSET